MATVIRILADGRIAHTSEEAEYKRQLIDEKNKKFQEATQLRNRSTTDKKTESLEVVKEVDNSQVEEEVEPLRTATTESDFSEEGVESDEVHPTQEIDMTTEEAETQDSTKVEDEGQSDLEDLTEESLHNMYKYQLVELCDKYGVDQSGTKDDLVTKLIRFQEFNYGS